MGKTIKDKIFKLIGFSGIIFGFFIFFIGLGMFFDSEPRYSDAGLPIMIVSGIAFIPGFIFIVLGIRIKNRERLKKDHYEDEMMDLIASVVRSYRRISIMELSQKLNISLPNARNYLLKALSENKIRGYFDRGTDEFFTEEANQQRLQFQYCPSCGAPFDRIYLQGETVKCKSCGMVL